MAHPFFVRLPAIAAAAALASAASAKETRLGSTCPKCGADGVVQTASEPEAAVRRSGEEALPPDYTRVTADDLRGQTAVGVEAQGDVIVERNQQVLNAEKVSYDQKTDTVGGGFILDDSGSTVRGDKLQYNLTAGSGKAEDVAMEAERDARRLQAVGKQAELILLIVPVALVQACGGSEPEALVLVHVVRNVCLCMYDPIFWRCQK